jgi:hypothetical protein
VGCSFATLLDSNAEMRMSGGVVIASGGQIDLTSDGETKNRGCGGRAVGAPSAEAEAAAREEAAARQLSAQPGPRRSSDVQIAADEGIDRSAAHSKASGAVQVLQLSAWPTQFACLCLSAQIPLRANAHKEL